MHAKVPNSILWDCWETMERLCRRDPDAVEGYVRVVSESGLLHAEVAVLREAKPEVDVAA